MIRRAAMRVMKFVCAGFVGAALLVGATAARAQDYPTREIRTICPFAPGTGADIVVRYYASKLAEIAGKPVITENRPGAQGLLGTEAVARAKPDRYTISIKTVA
jgi:tripartite-type tricarboxylate transporter receptor subunit TctC